VQTEDLRHQCFMYCTSQRLYTCLGQRIPPSSGIYFIVLLVTIYAYMEVCNKLASILQGCILFYCQKMVHTTSQNVVYASSYKMWYMPHRKMWYIPRRKMWYMPRRRNCGIYLVITQKMVHTTSQNVVYALSYKMWYMPHRKMWYIPRRKMWYMPCCINCGIYLFITHKKSYILYEENK
jgi:hypothetical protein